MHDRRLPSDAAPELVDELRNRILSGRYSSPGRLSEKILLDDLGRVGSKMPIRDALAQLDWEGLVKVEPRSGTYVCVLSLEDAKEILGIRLLLELHVAREIAQDCRRNLTSVEDIQERLRGIAREWKGSAWQELPDEQIARFADLDGEWHCELANSAGFASTSGLFLRLMRYRFRLLARPTARTFGEETVEEHEKILKALRAGDAPTATRRVAWHLWRVIGRWNLEPAADKQRLEEAMEPVFQRLMPGFKVLDARRWLRTSRGGIGRQPR